VIDTHAHLDACAEPADALVERAADAGVTRIVSVGTRPDSWRSTLEIAERHEGVFAALGLHPHEAESGDGALGALREALVHPRAVAVGETGLDYYRDYAPHAAQLRVFQSQLELAREVSKPVVIHNRAADEDVVVQLRGFEGSVVLHCFSSPSLLRDALDRGWYVSFAGNVTYKNAYDLRSAARAVPAERLLVETDSPYLAPQPRRGRPNEPANLVHTVASLAATRGEDADELSARLEANAVACFGLS
jgi:TatD DNase family protein